LDEEVLAWVQAALRASNADEKTSNQPETRYAPSPVNDATGPAIW
jgi:hypothetical protein